MRWIPALVLFPMLGLPPVFWNGYHESFDRARSLRRTHVLPGAGDLALEATTSGGQCLALRGVADFGLPVPRGRGAIIAFDVTLGPETSCSLGDDRDPQHGFGRLVGIDGEGRVRVGGTTAGGRLPPGVPHRITLRWTWLGETDLALQEVQIAGPGIDCVLAPEVKVPARQGAPLVFRQVAARGRVWIDEIRVLVRS